MSVITKTPLGVSGVALSLASLGNLLLPHGEWLRWLCGGLSAAVLTLFLLKLTVGFSRAREELKNPVVLSVMPTATMTAMLLCVYAKPFIGPAAIVLWRAAIVTQLFLMLLFARRFVVGFRLETVFPSWFVSSVGIAVTSVTCPAMDARPVGQIALCAALALFFIVLFAVVLRMVRIKPIPEPARPTIAILTAPMSLCLVGYMAAFEQPKAALVYCMLAVCVVGYIYVSVQMISLLRLPFYPTYASFTFPYVISAVAFKQANALLVRDGYTFFSFAPGLSEWIAVAAVVYVVLRYAMFLASKPGDAA